MNVLLTLGNKVKLSPIGEMDLEFARNLRNKMRDNFFSQEIITESQQKAWYKRYMNNYGTDYVWVIQLMDGTKIGIISLYGINHYERTGFVGRILLDLDYAGKGYLSDAIGIVTNIAFKHLHLCKLRLSVFSDNERAIKRYKACNFEALPKTIILMEKSNPDFSWEKVEQGEVYGTPI